LRPASTGTYAVVLHDALSVAHIIALHPENYVLSDVGGVVGNTLERAANHQCVQSLRSDVALLLHHLGQGFVGCSIQVVHRIIHRQHRAGQFGICLDEGLQALANHLRGERCHARNVHRQLHGRHLLHVANSLADAFGRVAHAFQVGIDLNHGDNESQVDRHGLLHGEQIERQFVDLALHHVDLALAFKHPLRHGYVTATVCVHGAVDRLLRQTAHPQQLFLQIVE